METRVSAAVIPNPDYTQGSAGLFPRDHDSSPEVDPWHSVLSLPLKSILLRHNVSTVKWIHSEYIDDTFWQMHTALMKSVRHFHNPQSPCIPLQSAPSPLWPQSHHWFTFYHYILELSFIRFHINGIIRNVFIMSGFFLSIECCVSSSALLYPTAFHFFLLPTSIDIWTHHSMILYNMPIHLLMDISVVTSFWL